MKRFLLILMCIIACATMQAQSALGWNAVRTEADELLEKPAMTSYYYTSEHYTVFVNTDGSIGIFSRVFEDLRTGSTFSVVIGLYDADKKLIGKQTQRFMVSKYIVDGHWRGLCCSLPKIKNYFMSGTGYVRFVITSGIDFTIPCIDDKTIQ